MLATANRIHEARKLPSKEVVYYENVTNIPGNFKATQTRRKHDSSKLVFPKGSHYKKPGYDFKTHYSSNFKNRPSLASPTRPCSPTRRNNPHPSKNFLTWRIPTRIFESPKDEDVSFINSNIDDTYHSFYDDYSGRKDHLKEVNAKLLLEMTKKYTKDAAAQKHRRKNNGIAEHGVQTDAENVDITLPNLLRKSWLPHQASRGLPVKSKKKEANTLRPLFINNEFQPLFQTWYNAASLGDKETVAKTVACLEENYIQKALESALKPHAIEAIEDWLMTADEEERNITMEFIQNILLADDGHEHKQAPLPYFENKKTTRKQHAYHKQKGCKICDRKDLEEALERLQEIASTPRCNIPGITELLNPLNSGVLLRDDRIRFLTGKRILRRPQKHKDIFPTNKGSVFILSKKPKGRDFTIHPEWV